MNGKTQTPSKRYRKRTYRVTLFREPGTWKFEIVKPNELYADWTPIVGPSSVVVFVRAYSSPEAFFIARPKIVSSLQGAKVS